MGIYEKYAEVYDSSGQIGFSLKMFPYLQELLERHPVEKGRMLDLACGTGDFCEDLRRVGLRAVGVDLSFGMLAAAPPPYFALQAPPDASGGRVESKTICPATITPICAPALLQPQVRLATTP